MVRTMSSAPNPYDSVAYPGRAFAQTHPDRLAVMATLLGMTPAPVEQCRVLELACGDGSNLIPMAYGLPKSEFYGVDLAAKPVARANAIINRAGLRNIRIEQMDLRDLDDRLGKFDYIIAHGVYAWVPPDLQEKILSVCCANLAERGIAYVSYNTDPAGAVRLLLREMMQFHAARARASADPVKTTKEFAAAILEIAEDGSAWKTFLQHEFKLMFDRDDRVTFHDDLGECFTPVSFADFSARASRHGLQILAEPNVKSLLQPDIGPERLEALNQLAGNDSLAFQSYLDFATYRRFRQTLLCHANVPLRRDRILQQTEKLLIASPLHMTAEQPAGTFHFANTRGHGTIQTNNPHFVRVLRRLEEIWPRAVPCSELLNSLPASIPESQQNNLRNELLQTLLGLAAPNLLELRAHEVCLSAGVSARPTASLLARLQAEEGSLITTLLHLHVELEDELGRKFLTLLDGTRTREALADAIAPADPSAPREAVLQSVDENLAKFYRMGLLIS